MPAPQPSDPPDDDERPVPVTRADDDSSDPRSWDVDGAAADGPAHPRPEDEVREDQAHATRDDRRDRAEGRREPTTRADDESAYPTETEQGAAQPGPASV